jgi:hypothetical protein
MMERFSRYVLHPFFVAAYPILFLLSINAGQLPLQQAGRVLAVSLFSAIILILLFGAPVRDFRRGGFLASVVLALFFSYGHVYNGLEKGASFLANKIFLDVLWGGLLLAGGWAAYKIRNIVNVNKYLNLLMLFLLIQPMLSLLFFMYKSGIPQEIKPPSPFDNVQVGAQYKQNLPDIYYIILDGHGRSDVVKEIFGYDNSPFIDHLRERGFYVADQSRSNYIQTVLSISSSLNFDYLNLDGISSQSSDRDPLENLIVHSELRSFLEKQGYKTVTFSTGYNTTTIEDADIVIPYYPNKFFNSFEELLLTTTFVTGLSQKAQNQLFVDPFKCDIRRGYTLNIYENLKKIPELPGPKFIFAHILSPHPPFIFDAEGNPVERGGCRVNDGEYFIGTREDYMTGYPQQLAFVDTMISEVVDAILAKSKTPPVIIIQGDHGSGMLLDWSSMKKTCKRERTTILNAYYFPGEKYSQLYQSITPVNSFRAALNASFNLNLPLLEDRSYYSGWYKPYDLIDVTDKLEPACKIKK